jgi:hypothetical protein
MNFKPHIPVHPLWTDPGHRYWGNYWESWSPKLNRRVRFYSDLEYSHWLTVESDPSIERFCEQPFRVGIYIDGKGYSSIPDMWLRRRNGDIEIREIKYSSALSADRNQRQIKAQKQWCELHGYRHSVVDEKTICANPVYLKNVSQLIHWVKIRPNPNESDIQTQINQFIRNQGRQDMPTILSYLSLINIDDIRSALARMVLSGIVCANISTVSISTETTYDLA